MLFVQQIIINTFDIDWILMVKCVCVLTARRPAVTVSELRDSFLSGRGGVARGAVQHQLIVRIINKSHLMYYGRTDRNCDCPYKVREHTHTQFDTCKWFRFNKGPKIEPCWTPNYIWDILTLCLSRRSWRCVTAQEVCVWCCGTVCVSAGIAVWSLVTSSAWDAIESNGITRLSQRT